MKHIQPYFSQNPLNRLDNLRGDTTKIKEFQNYPSTLFLLLYEDEFLCDAHGYFHSHETLLTCKHNQDEIILLGVCENIHYFCLHVNTFPKNLKPISLRKIAQELHVKEELLGILAQALSVLSWHNSHTNCSNCGAKSTMAHSGWRRDCPKCKKEHFPRTDPVVIMLVTHEDYCLLGRGIHFLPNRYSCLAGYMESGESIEDAARRELFEEAGVIGGEVTYVASQPWPFPTTLMIGVHVKALSKELHIDTNEIADAKWIHKNDIKKILDGDENFGISTPREMAIARNLLEWWVK